MIAKAFAPAKINLSLHVTGQRADGYHLLDSLVVFADIGDELSLEPAAQTTLSIGGPEAANLSAAPDNLVLRAAALFPKKTAHIELVKALPVASGIGGGSADAAATLRGMAALFDVPLPGVSECLTLGADVPVCLRGVPTRMRGIGDQLDAVPDLPTGMGIVLVNPRVGVATPLVFKALASKDNPGQGTLPNWPDALAFGAWLQTQRNDLQAPAISAVPQIETVLEALQAANPLLARMSGSGATCFGVFENRGEAKVAAQAVAKKHPDWWIKSGQILSDGPAQVTRATT